MYAALSQAQQPVPNHDAAKAISNSKCIIDVLANDNPGSCTRSTIRVSVAPAASGAKVTIDADNKLIYTSPAGFSGYDTLAYTITCGALSGTAKVYVTVYGKPDNIGDVECSITPSAGVWDMEQKEVSDVPVYWLATPFAGDLDRDGHPEVVVPGVENSGGSTASSILILDEHLKLKQTITMPSGITMPEVGTMTFLIADVDNDGYGEIVVCTSDQRLRCYSYNGTLKWVSNGAYGGSEYNCPSLIIADIDGDGNSEILASDRIFAGESGQVLATLPASGGRGFASGGPASYMPVFADVNNDGRQEVVAGSTVYKVKIANRTGMGGNSATVLANAPNALPDGFTSVADIDMDGDLDVVVTGGHKNTDLVIMYVWDGATDALIGNGAMVQSSGKRVSRPFVGDIDNDGRPDIAFSYTNKMSAYRYVPASKTFQQIFQRETTDDSGATTMSMFDFNQDGEVELVYRDEKNLRIIDRYGNNKITFPCASSTHTEYPIVVDLDRDGHADILVSGNTSGDKLGEIRIIRYGSIQSKWAPARPVWNQHAYNSLNINDDLSVPKFPLNPATVFPGADNQPGTADDIRPYNAFLKQQTILDINGTTYWPASDAFPVESESSLSVSDNSISVTVAVCNQGSEKIGAPVHVTLYNGTVAAANKLATGILNDVIHPGDTGYVTATYTGNKPVMMIVARVNDNDGNYPYYPECRDDNNELFWVNPMCGRYMHKNASVNNVPGNGYYGNPVSVLYNEVIQYKIAACNVNRKTGTVTVVDTLPAYLRYVPKSAIPSSGAFVHDSIGMPAQDVLTWTLNSLDPLADTVVSYNATPAAGVCASQPVFINRAWITLSDTIKVVTGNSTYHQGAGVSFVLFSAGYGGSVYNAQPQALDYGTSAREGVLVVPDEGYAFAGWSHGDYPSLRNEPVMAKSGIMHYDTLAIFGNVELTANFELIRYPIHYHLNGGENIGNNPEVYTKKSGVITLGEPRKAGDVFLGWTGSNGTEPQKTVTIPDGTAGELRFYANYLYSGREDKIQPDVKPDKIWGAKGELYVETSKTGSVVIIYSTEGTLESLHTILLPGITKIKLQHGIHIVTLNNGVAQKIIID
jgi:uncharacterized repeat protein (TIGR02543 family)